MSRPRRQLFSSDGTVYTSPFMKTGRSSISNIRGFGSFRIAYWTPPRFLLTISSFDHGRRFPTTETSRGCSLIVEYDHRDHESRKGGLKRHPGQGSFWLRRCSSNNDQGTFPPFSDVPLQDHTQPGLDNQQIRLRRARVSLCQCM